MAHQPSSSSTASGLAERLAQDIQERVASGSLPIGTWLRQETLASDFGVSRTPIREALQKLHARGIIEWIPNRGARVRLPTIREIREAYLVRAELEGVAAEFAAGSATDDQIARLREAEQLFERAIGLRGGRGRRRVTEDGTEWTRANDLFHEAVQEASGNQQLRHTIRALHRTFPRSLTWRALDRDLRLLKENVNEHHAIRLAIEEGDGTRARVLMVQHVKHAGELIALRIGESQPIVPRFQDGGRNGDATDEHVRGR
ncbi:MAG: GntR family transcriptional regulator [Gaiellaceae bacterium]